MIPATKDRIYEYISQKGGGVSFVEIREEFGEGNYDMSTPTNLVFFSGLTDKTVDGIIELLKEKRILMYPTSPLIYLVDGCVCNLPLAKRPPTNGYKEPHWIPVVLWTIEQIKKGMKEGVLMTDPRKAALFRESGYDI